MLMSLLKSVRTKMTPVHRPYKVPMEDRRWRCYHCQEYTMTAFNITWEGLGADIVCSKCNHIGTVDELFNDYLVFTKKKANS